LLVNKLGIILGGARNRGGVPGHILLQGPPGLGKTTFAQVIATESHGQLVRLYGPSLKTETDIGDILLSDDRLTGDVIFIDEIHAVPRAVGEILYPAMEDFALDVVLGKGPTVRTVRLDLPRFTLVGATTRPALIDKPLRDRFVYSEQLEYYTDEDLAQVVLRAAGILGVRFDPEAALEVGRRSGGTPRMALNHLTKLRDFASYQRLDVVTLADVNEGLALFGIDSLGLDKVGRAMLELLCVRFAGNPVGIATLANALGEHRSSLEDVQEPFLQRQGLIVTTSRGRQATPAAFEHLGLRVPLSVR
jgi:Holliday junction DNA helicase RuvB